MFEKLGNPCAGSR